MIFSRSKNFIFIHIAKNGGSSIKKALGKYGIKTLKRTRFNEITTRLPYQRLPEKMVYFPHKDAKWLRTRVGGPLFDSMFSFAIVRNPFDQLVSRYEYIKTNENHHFYQAANRLEFGDFLIHQKWRDINFSKSQYSKVTDKNGNVIVSKIFRFEKFNDILNELSSILDIKNITEVPHENSSIRKPYQEYYTDKSIRFVEKNFKSDLDFFDYKF
jgi:hypothetical protein